MKKIIAAFDGLKYSASTRDYAIQLAKQNDSHLVGVFLDDLTYHSYKVYDLIRDDEKRAEEKQKLLERNDQGRRSAAVSDFETACRKAGVQYSIHHDRGIAIHELLHESIYADLLVIDYTETLTHYPQKVPTRFIRDLLADVQCPVLLVPHRYKQIAGVTLLYNAEPSSVFAIKMFSYILGSLKQYPVEVLSVKPLKDSLHLQENRLIREFMKRHFPKSGYKVMKGMPELEIVYYLEKQKEQSLVVLGAYRRGTVSRWFRESMADILMKDLKLPLFIAHNK